MSNGPIVAKATTAVNRQPQFDSWATKGSPPLSPWGPWALPAAILELPFLGTAQRRWIELTREPQMMAFVTLLQRSITGIAGLFPPH
jgi:hypothetical protein